MDGKLKRQVKGIPMGDPHSPGMTLLTCAWMEMEWKESLTPEVKNNFNGKTLHGRHSVFL